MIIGATIKRGIISPEVIKFMGNNNILANIGWNKWQLSTVKSIDSLEFILQFVITNKKTVPTYNTNKGIKLYLQSFL